MLDWANIVILVFEPLTFKVFKFGLVTWSLNENIAASLNHSYSCLELWSFRKICIHHNLNIKFTPQSRNKRPIAHRHVHTHTSTQLSSTVFELNDRKTEQTHSEIHAHYKHLQQRKKKKQKLKNLTPLTYSSLFCTLSSSSPAQSSSWDNLSETGTSQCTGATPWWPALSDRGCDRVGNAGLHHSGLHPLLPLEGASQAEWVLQVWWLLDALEN